MPRLHRLWYEGFTDAFDLLVQAGALPTGKRRVYIGLARGEQGLVEAEKGELDTVRLLLDQESGGEVNGVKPPQGGLFCQSARKAGK